MYEMFGDLECSTAGRGGELVKLARLRWMGAFNQYIAPA